VKAGGTILEIIQAFSLYLEIVGVLICSYTVVKVLIRIHSNENFPLLYNN